MKTTVFLMGISLFALSPFFVLGQLLDPVEYSIVEMPDTVKAGEPFKVTVNASIDQNWHLYSILNDPDAGPNPTRFSTPSSIMTISGDVEESKAEIAFDPNFETDLGWHSDSAQFTIPVVFNSNLQGSEAVLLEVLYQVCDDRSCLPPKTKQVQGEIYLTGNTDEMPAEQISDQSSGTSFLNIVEWFWLVITLCLTLYFVYLLFQKFYPDKSSMKS